MQIIFDARYILVDNRFDGVSRYTHELAWALAAYDELEITWLIHDDRQRSKLPPGSVILANEPSDALRELFIARTLNKTGINLVYSPFFTMGTFGKDYKLVLTIHDLIYFTHRTPPQWLPWHIRFGWRLFHLSFLPLRWQLNRADIVATVSETARQEIIDRRATRRPVITVSNAVNQNFADTEKRDHSQMNNIVYMGAFTPYKNVETVIAAAALIPEITLHLCGKLPDSRRPSLEKYIAEKNLTDRVIIYNGATDEQYLAALSQARCAISASRLEGFGLPLLEAQQHGVPFVAADTAIFHEVGKDSVLYFDPDSPEDAAAQIRKLADKELSDNLIDCGFKNAASYTWQASAAAAHQIITSLK